MVLISASYSVDRIRFKKSKLESDVTEPSFAKLDWARCVWVCARTCVCAKMSGASKDADGAGPASPPEWEQRALTMIRRTVELLTPERCCLSFNGGKDSTALFHLIRAAVPDGWHRMRYV